MAQINYLKTDSPLTPQSGRTGFFIQTDETPTLITSVGIQIPLGTSGDVDGKVSKTGDTMTGSLLMSAPAGIDSIETGGSDILNLGTQNADIINIGWANATINIQGTLLYQNVEDLHVQDKLIGLNIGGSAGSATGSGFEIEEDAVITGC
jgi:hypothetical protein